MITIETKLGDTVVNWYGETKVVVAETPKGKWWIVRDVRSGRETMVHKVTADSVAIVGMPIENGGI